MLPLPLEQIQSLFAHAVHQPVGVADQAEGRSVTPRFVAGNDRLSPIAQLEIYREQFWLRHVGALEEDFATLVHLLGHDGFHSLVERYIEAHPPRAFSLRDLGAELPLFVARESPYREDPLVLDCARLEWAFVDAFDAPDAAPLDAASIASVPEDAWPGARVSFHPSVQRVALAHPAHEYRAMVRAKEGPTRPEAAPVHVVVYRGPEMLQYIAIEPLAFDLLERLAQGETLGDACEAIAASTSSGGGETELEEKIGGWFQLWAASGWLTALSV